MVDESHLRLENIGKSFGSEAKPLSVLEGLNLDVAYGEFLSLLGPSGCGKSTLLRIIGGLLEPDSGEVAISDKTPKEAQAEKTLGFVFQAPSLLPWRTVIDNIRLPLEVNRRQDRIASYSTQEMVKLVGLEAFEEYYPFQLSGGMQQRVTLARALVFNPSLLLMDEPLGNLDEITRAAMRYELLRIWDLEKKTVVFVTHSIPEAIIMSDRVVVLSRRPGRIKGIVDIDLPRPRLDSMERSEEFLDYAGLLHRMLKEEGVNGSDIIR